MRFLKILKIELPYDPATSLLGIDPKDSIFYHRHTCMIMFTAALIRVSKNTRCSLAYEWEMRCSRYILGDFIHLSRTISLQENWSRLKAQCSEREHKQQKGKGTYSSYRQAWYILQCIPVIVYQFE